MGQQVSFSSLPPELVSKICSDPGLDKEDLIALRLTSKAQGMHASATKAFAKRYFTDVLLLYSEYSLETFVEISQHPIFGPSIRKVQLSCAQYDEEHFEDEVKNLLGQNHERRELMRMIQEIADRCDHDHQQFDPDRASALLEQAFRQLAKSDNSFVLAVSTDEEKSLGRSEVLGPRMGSASWWSNPQVTLGYVLRAADTSGLRIRKVEIKVETSLYSEIENQNYILSEWTGMRSLRSLPELTYDMKTTDFDDQRDPSMLVALLKLTPHLRSLRIALDDWTDEVNGLRPLVEQISRLPLEELHLDHVYMERRDVTDMLGGLGSTLRRLDVSGCSIWVSWKQVMLCIQQHCFRLDRLRIGGGNKRRWLSKSMLYEGSTEVRLGVAELLQARKDMYEIDEGDIQTLGEDNVRRLKPDELSELDDEGSLFG
jgi:hypothetical protein